VLCCRAWLGYHIYGNIGPRTIRIGPRTIIKWGINVDLAEADTMRFVAEHTSVPVPKVFDAWTHGKVTVIKMRYIKGRLAWSAWDRLTSVQQASVCSELEGYVKQLRSLSPPSPCQVSAIHGGPCRDHRFGSVPIGPFRDHDTFHSFLRQDADLLSFQSRYPDVLALHSGCFVSMFTHGDLTLWNVVVRKGKIAAIIDWECSGWRPDYWEYTKAHYNPQGTPQQWFDALSRTTGEYNEHLKGERCLWVAHEFPASPAEYPSK